MIRVELPALIGRLNDISRQALEASAALCISRQGAEITPAHLLFKLLETPFSDVRQILEHTGINHQQLQPVVGDSLNGEPQTAEPYPSFSPLLVELMQDAWLLASTELGHTELRSGAVFLALLMNADRYLMPRVAQALVDINREQLRKQFDRVTEGSVERPQLTESGGARPAVEADMDPLKRYATDFTKLAREDKLDPVVCRDAEIDQMIDILCRRRKNNPIVVGDAGVGKSAVVEGLALRIVNGDVPDRLKNVELWTLDMGALQAGASVKGEFEKRLKGVIEAVKGSATPIILFIDEAHTLIGAGNSEGGSDAANLLKPALARGELRTIAATTWREYKKYFEKDPALSRRFQPVALDEPTPGEAVHILRGLRTVYEKAHQVLIADSALKAAAEMSARYLAGRQLPDKAIDVLDTACARVSLNLSTPPRRLSHVRSELHQLAMEQELLSREHTLGQNADAEREQELEQRCRNFPVINASVSGETTAGGKSRLPALLEEHDPDIVVIELGGNDGLRGLSPLAMAGNLREMIDNSRAAGATPVLLGMRIPPNYGQQYTRLFEQQFRQVSDDKEVPLFPFFLEGVVEQGWLQKDGIHPTTEAQPLLKAHAVSVLAPLLPAQCDRDGENSRV